MKQFLSVALLTISIFAIEHKSDVSLNYIYYDNYANELTLEGNTELKYDNEFFKSLLSVEYLYSSEYDDRRYILLNEIYATKEYDDYSFTFGKTIKFWGEMEGFNIADIYNQKNYLLDPFEKSNKLGSIGLSAVRYFDKSSIELGVKLYEENLKYPSKNSPYYPFDFGYDEELYLSNQTYTPTLYLNFSFATDEYVDSESKIIFLHGYDNKRYFILTPVNLLSQYAYRVNKLLFLSHILYKDTIFKCEGGYTDVIEDELISDYAQLSFGFEKSFYDIASSDLGIYLEYYRYIYIQDEKIENVDISEIYENDLFLALKVDFNNIKKSEMKGGILYDVENKEKLYKLEFQSRTIDNLTLKAEYLQIITGQNSDTLFSSMGDSKRINFRLEYAF